MAWLPGNTFHANVCKCIRNLCESEITLLYKFLSKTPHWGFLGRLIQTDIANLESILHYLLFPSAEIALNVAWGWPWLSVGLHKADGRCPKRFIDKHRGPCIWSHIKEWWHERMEMREVFSCKSAPTQALANKVNAHSVHWSCQVKDNYMVLCITQSVNKIECANGCTREKQANVLETKIITILC